LTELSFSYELCRALLDCLVNLGLTKADFAMWNSENLKSERGRGSC
jgi:hypothetical protein